MKMNYEYVLMKTRKSYLSLSRLFLVGEAQAWASAGQPKLADRRKWPTPTTTRTGPIHRPRAQRTRHKERLVRDQALDITHCTFIYTHQYSHAKGNLHSYMLQFPFLSLCFVASSSVAGAVGMTTSGESESDDSEMGRLQGMFAFAFSNKAVKMHCMIVHINQAHVHAPLMIFF